MVPDGWHRHSLEDVAQIRTGVAKGKRGIVDPIRRPYLRVANVQDGYLDLEEIKEIEIAAKDVDRYKLEPGDIVLTEGGDFDKLGRGAIWPGGIEECLHQNHVFAVRVDRSKLLPEFFAAQTGSHYGRSYFLSCAKRTTNLASINSTQLKQFPALVPPLPEQRKIAEILSTWDRAIETTEALLANARTQKRALMQSLLTGKRRFPEFEGQEWREVRLGEICDIIAGHPFESGKFSDSGALLVRGSNVKRGNLDWSPNITRFWPDPTGYEHLLITESDVVLAMDGALVGRSYTFVSEEPETPMLLVQRVARLRAKVGADPYFVFSQIDNPSFHRHVDAVKTVTAIPHISMNDIRDFVIRCPSTEEQSKIGTFLMSEERKIDRIAQDLFALRTQKKALMQQLLTGKRRVQV